jgi:hypothetical protein
MRLSLSGESMQRAFWVACSCLVLSACAYRPTPTELVRIDDSPADVRNCRRLEAVSGDVATGPGFGAAVEAMLQASVALGGTDLYLVQRSADWSVVRGVAYRCGAVGVRPPRVILSVRG